MDNTIVGVFESSSKAEQVRQALVAAGYDSSKIHVAAEGGERSELSMSDSSADSEPRPHEGAIAHFFRTLFGGDDEHEDSGHYREAVRRGYCMVSVESDDSSEIERAREIMEENDAIDFDRRVEQWRQQGWQGYNASAPAFSPTELEEERSWLKSDDQRSSADKAGPGERTRIPVVQEELNVGKRQVSTGGVRIYTRVTDQPVEERHQVREERARVERRQVDRPATEADMNALKDGQIEVRETAEELVVSKTARVVEEVEIAKDVSEREEVVRDTVRRTNVEVEDLPASRANPTDPASAKKRPNAP